MRLRRKAWPAIVALAAPLAACAPVGPDYLRPAAIVPPQYKEIKGWKVASPHDDLAKGEWWRLFADPTLDKLESQVAVSNQTIKADEANYRTALALIAEARAGLLPTINFNPSFTRVKSGTQLSDQLDAEVSGSWTLDVWGKTRRSVEQESAAAEASAADLANATLAAQSALALAYVQLRQSDSLADLLDSTVKQYKRSVDIAQNQYNAGAAAKSDVITAQALELAAEAQAVNVGVARAQSEHAIAVLTGRAPAELTILALVLTIAGVIAAKAWSGRGTPLRGGLPSGHAAIAFAAWIAATYIAGAQHRFLISSIVFVLALLVAQTRVESGVHSMFEVLLGGLLGALTTLAMFQLAG